MSDLLREYSYKFARLYASIMEAFILSLGVTEENIQEWETQKSYGWSDELYIVHNDVRVGKILTITKSDLTGYQIVIECVDLRPTSGGNDEQH